MSFPIRFIIAQSIDEANLPVSLLRPSLNVVHLQVTTFGIDEARWLKGESITKSFNGVAKTFVIVAKSITIEAQNALLKLLEECPVGVNIVFIVAEDNILDTLRSRLVGVEVVGGQSTDQATLFINSSYTKRLSLISDLFKNKDEKQIDNTFRGLETSLDVTANVNLKEAVWLASKYRKNRGSNRKMLLENIALLWPTDTK